jgi:Tfp pilus assembly protein FimV
VAFGSGNINLLRQGAVLQRPSSAELDRLDAAAAEAMVRLQIQQWRSGDMPPVAPEVSSPTAPAIAAEPTAQARTGAPKLAPARLEIAPATEADAVQAATGAGQAAGQDATARERAAADLVAARYTEFQQMQQRIAELEQTQKAQQRLLELKDRQLAAQRPQSAGTWPWLIAALAVLIAAATFWRSRRAEKPGRVARRLASMVGARRDAAAASPTR